MLLLAALLSCNLDTPPAFEVPHDVWTIGDVDHDGELDVVTAASNAVTVAYGTSGDAFEPPRLVAADRGHALALADADGDGRTDIFVSSLSSPRGTVLLRNRGGRTFAAPESVFPATNVAPVAADIDGDGDPDLVASSNDGMLITARNDGRGRFTAGPQSLLGTGIGVLRAGDFDGDGQLDVVGLSSPVGARLLRGNGTGAFALAQSLAIVNHGYSLTAADLNGDGRTDMAVVDGQTIRIDFGLGTPVTIAVPATPWGTRAADLDSDGDQDLLVLSRGTSGGAALLNDGGGQLRPAAELPGSLAGMVAQLGDTDRDGTLDLIVSAGGTIAVAHGHGAGRFRAPAVRALEPGRMTFADVDGEGADDVLSILSDFLKIAYANGRVEQIAIPRLTFGVFAADVTDAPGLELLVSTELQLIVYERRSLGWNVLGTIAGPGNPMQATLAGARLLAVLWVALDGGVSLETYALDAPNVPHWRAALAPNMAATLIARDFTGDGVNDLLVTGAGSRSSVPNESPLRDGYLSLFRGRGDGTFDGERRILSNESLLPTDAGDFDRDGDLDLVIGMRRGGGVVVLRNDGRGTFGAAEVIEEETDRNLVRYAVGDLNGDGTADLVTSVANLRLTLHLGTRNGFLTRPPVLGRGQTLLIANTPRPALFVLGQSSMTVIGVKCKDAPRTLTTTTP